MINILKSKLLKFFYGLLLIPFCYAIFVVFIFLVKDVDFSNRHVIVFFLGCVSYFVFHFLFYKPIRFYVIGHEIVHAISAVLCGAKVSNFKLKKNSGSVNVEKVNTFIALSPYFVPIYSIFLIIIWGVLRYILNLQIKMEIFIFLLGMSVMFHLVLTFYAVSIGQSDFNVSGWFFSLVMIFISNMILLFLILLLIFPNEKSYNDIINKVYFETKVSYLKAYNIIKYIINNFLKFDGVN